MIAIQYGISTPQIQEVETLVATVHAYHRAHILVKDEGEAEADMEDQADRVEAVCKEIRRQGS